MTPNKTRCIVVIFSCRCCDSIYEAIQEHTKGRGNFDCAECGATVHSWSGDYRFSDWLRVLASDKLREPPQMVGKKPDQPSPGRHTRYH